ncbi:MAG: leucyl aminopeptidase family protein [Paracoccus sp. (in: a-proteobacteria)]|uniref:leucyl aminopeptidase family protein n=1 Tax=Paracoccus sp. TaxID=267 RepID=UPI0026DFCF6A|nr:leucyl aminopeptidase family protein [Paracoccus sp. (in: a-proteobacteria)]MDO5613307.1 leucyl aminopeptidase family protein [Paracoccus sp. (in: a-proteobacteria)]
MTASPAFAPPSPDARPLWLVAKGAPLPKDAGDWPAAAGFAAKAGEICLLPDGNGGLRGALFGLGDPARAGRGRFALARAADALPAGDWYLAGDLPGGVDPDQAALGWLLAGYRFDRYANSPAPRARLVAPGGVDAAQVQAIAAGEYLTRDLINTPAADMGPADLADAAADLARRIGAAISVTTGDALLEAGFPMIHAVGRAAAPGRAPRLIDLRLGGSGPAVTLVGKGVCFDTGGLNLKPGASMGLMKKDMGGAATVLGLAQMLADTGAARQMNLRVLIPAVENAVSGDAIRPGDILRSRKGLTVEINNTDAEGRLVLADALAFGAEERPDLMISMATLTGAARVALGPDIPPFYCDDDALAAALARASAAVADPIWRMPFWEPYEAMIEPGIADLDNAPSGGMAGSITAALFLRRFAQGAGRYAHFDIYGWQPTAAPGRPKGGVGQGARAILAALPQVLA